MKMTLKQFEKVNAATHTRYTVFDANNEYVESFSVNYCSGVSFEESVAGIIKRSNYKNATVEYVAYSRIFAALTVTIKIKGVE